MNAKLSVKCPKCKITYNWVLDGTNNEILKSCVRDPECIYCYDGYEHEYEARRNEQVNGDQSPEMEDSFRIFFSDYDENFDRAYENPFGLSEQALTGAFNGEESLEPFDATNIGG